MTVIGKAGDEWHEPIGTKDMMRNDDPVEKWDKDKEERDKNGKKTHRPP